MNSLVQSPKQITLTDLTPIVIRASFLWERLDAERFAIEDNLAEDNLANEHEIQQQIDRWCQVVAQGSWDTLQKRLQWEGLDLETIRPRLGAVSLNADQPLPDWAETLHRIMQTTTEFTPERETNLPIDPDHPLPFEDMLLPAIKVARQQLLTQLETPTVSLLSETAYRSLERSLLQRLVGLCSKTLNFEFSQVRPFGQSLLNLLDLQPESRDRKMHYTRFVTQLLQDGLLTLFQKYPVLGRLVATAVNFWVEFTAEFLQRLANDHSDLQCTFGVTVAPLSQNKVIEIQTSLSDPHKRGRTVIVFTFESGLKLVYKPKNLGLEVAFNQFLDWCNQHSNLLEFKVTQVLDRNDYGWVEYVEHLPCVDQAAAERFYERAGMLLCVLYALRGTDCHYENLIANGEHLVLIDMETLLHHEPKLIDDSPLEDIETSAAQQFWGSVLRTGLLPRWDFSSDFRMAYDISGLGSTTPQFYRRNVPRWQRINTDDMHLRSEAIALPVEKNVPRLGEIALSPHEYRSQIVAGFEQMYRFLVVHREVLLSPDSPLTAMQNQQVRFVFRATRIYTLILQKTLSPDHLKHGVDFSIQLDHLSRAFIVAQEKPSAFPVLSAELRSMEQLDVPFFTASAVIDELKVGSFPPIQNYFKQSSYQDVLNQLQMLDDTDLARQIAIIQGSFDAQVASFSEKEQPWNAESLPLLSAEQLLQEAQAIATELETRAIPDVDGSINWIGLDYVVQAERYQLHTLGDSLCDGRSGIALFFAALSHVSDDSRYRELAYRTIQPLRRQIHTLDLEARQRLARFTGIGGATGLGSMIYSLVKISQFLDDATLLQDAQALADWITPALIVADDHFDVMSGAAGAILGLLSLYDATQKATVLETAIAGGQHLITHQQSGTEGAKAWKTFWDQPLTGFSHGAAGNAYALLKLYAVSHDRAYSDAALEAIEYERSVFSKTEANWPDFRRSGPSGQIEFASKWCHGATGIGLGRLGCSRILPTSDIQQEIEIALQTTQSFGLRPIDHLCCGNLGRAEVLLVGSQLCQRPEWQQVALQNATNVVSKAKRTGAYQLFPNLPTSVYNPGFLAGTSGIGYALLRLAHPALPSVLLWD